jgi:hypothetical protein
MTVKKLDCSKFTSNGAEDEEEGEIDGPCDSSVSDNGEETEASAVADDDDDDDAAANEDDDGDEAVEEEEEEEGAVIRKAEVTTGKERWLQLYLEIGIVVADEKAKVDRKYCCCRRAVG